MGIEIMDYHLLVKFGEVVVPVTTNNLRELTIVQDLNAFLPEFRLRLKDVSGSLTHVIPSDKNINDIFIEIGSSPSGIDKNSFQFVAYDKKPIGDQSNPSTMYDVTGLLDIPMMFAPSRSRAHSGNISSSLSSVALSEFQVDSTEISPSLAYSKTLLQPQWSNIQFLKWLRENVIGRNSEYGFKCFIKRENSKTVFVFKSLKELTEEPISYKFVVNAEASHDYLPVFKYSIFDYYKLYGSFASKKQEYGYFDYDTSEFVTREEQSQDYTSLADYWLIDGNDSEDSDAIVDLGRSNSFTSDFGGRVKSSFSNRLMSLAKMWITTIGTSGAVPGQIVQIFFPHGSRSGGLYSYQYSGYWLVERVVHNIGEVFITKLLLTRNGVDTDKSTTLVKSTNVRSS